MYSCEREVKQFESITGFIPPKLIKMQMLAQPAGLSEHSNKTHITELPKFCTNLYILVDMQASHSRKL